MTEPLGPASDGQTELSEEDRNGLLPSYISTRGELNDAEQRNMARVLLRRPLPTVGEILDDGYLRDLHKAMFGDVWHWAGRYRLRETNIGFDPTHITVAVRALVDDARTWVERDTFGADELCVRFHHRLVAIHPFPNGNGRHARVASDYLIRALGQDAFSWGAHLGLETADLRSTYLAALRRADRDEMAALVAFARSRSP